MPSPQRNEETRVSAQAEFELDPEFESAVIRAMLLSPGFVSSYRSLLTEDLFTRPHNKYLCTVLLRFFDEYRESPSVDVLVDLIRCGEYRARGSLVEEVKELQPVENLQYVADRVTQWARWQKITYVLDNDTRDDPRRFGILIEEASRTGEHLKGGEIVMGSGLPDEHIEYERTKILTPWASLNERLRGGPEYGHLCIIESFINVGKTALLVNVGAAALAQGEIVCYGVFEDGELEIRRRFHQHISGMTQEEMISWPEESRRRVQDWLSMHNGKLYIKRLRSRRSSVEDFAGWVRSVTEREGRECRLAISDYADRFAAPRRRSEDRQEYREIYEECKLMAQDLDLVHWTALQANRSSHNQDVVGLEFTGESIGKAEGADLVLGAGQTAEDVELGIINLFSAKVRGARKHEQWRLNADFERQRITEID
jgi:replicative DNA helicase